jgi:hypothetical protein
MNPVEFGEPLPDIGNDGLQQNTVANHPNSYAVSLESKLSRKTNGLAAPVAKQLANSSLGLRHGLSLFRHLIYTINIYHDAIDLCKDWGCMGEKRSGELILDEQS